MVHFTPLTLAATTLLTLVTAAPMAQATTDSEPVFSFAKWVDDIIAHPDTALGPEEAWQAYIDTVNSTSTSSSLEKRWDAAVICNDLAPGPAYVSTFPSSFSPENEPEGSEAKLNRPDDGTHP